MLFTHQGSFYVLAEQGIKPVWEDVRYIRSRRMVRSRSARNRKQARVIQLLTVFTIHTKNDIKQFVRGYVPSNTIPQRKLPHKSSIIFKSNYSWTPLCVMEVAHVASCFALLCDVTKPSFAPILTYHHWDPARTIGCVRELDIWNKRQTYLTDELSKNNTCRQVITLMVFSICFPYQ